MRLLRAILCVVLFVEFSGGLKQAFANPSDRNPNAPLAVHGTIPEAKALAARLYATYDRIRILELDSIKLKSTPNKLSGKKLMQAAGEIWKALRDARHLQEMGEPAGYDIQLKLGGARGNIVHYAVQWGASASGMSTKAKTKQQLEKSVPKLQKLAERAQKLLEGGQPEAFGSLVEREGQQLAAALSLFPPKRKPAAEKYLNFFSSADDQIAAVRRQRYVPIANAAVAKNIAVSEQFVDGLTNVSSEISQSGAFSTADGETKPASEALRYIVDEWGKASAATIRAHAIKVAFMSSGAEPASAGGESAGLDSQASDLASNAVNAIASVINAIAGWAPRDQVPLLYNQILLDLSLAQRRMGSNAAGLIQACRQSLETLAKKDPQFGASVAAYVHAVSPMLQWRERYAAKSAEALRKQYVSSAALLVMETETPSSPGRKSRIAPDSINRRVSFLMDDTTPRLVGERVSGPGVLRLSSNGRLGVVPYANGHYCLIALPINLDEELAELKEAVLVDGEHPALSLDAAGAISAAEMQEFEAVGGVIRNVTLEARLVRFAALPDVASVIQPLGTLPKLGDYRNPPLKAACWRLDVQPMWAQNRYFVATAN